MKRLVGKGYELGVFQDADRLILGIPVDFGMRSFGFEFVISSGDLAVLTADPFRRKALDLILHARLQPRLTQGDHDGLDVEILPVIRQVLHGSAGDVDRMIAQSPEPGFIRMKLAKAGF